MSFYDLLMYLLSTVGMCHIVVDGSILEWFRDFVKKAAAKCKMPKLGTIVDCYMCAGTWCGFLMGYVWLVCPRWEQLGSGLAWAEVFACGCAGGFLSNFAAVLLNWIEANTMVHLPEEKLPE